MMRTIEVLRPNPPRVERCRVLDRRRRTGGGHVFLVRAVGASDNGGKTLWHVARGIRPGGIYSIVSEEWEEAEDPGQPGVVHRTRHFRTKKDKSRMFGPRNPPVPQADLDSGPSVSTDMKFRR